MVPGRREVKDFCSLEPSVSTDVEVDGADPGDPFYGVPGTVGTPGRVDSSRVPEVCST